MAWPHSHRHGDGGRVRICRLKLSVTHEGRQKDHRSALVGTTVLWAATYRCGAAEQWGARWLSWKRRRNGLREKRGAPSTRENRRRKAWSRRSTRSTPSAKLAQPTFSPRNTKAGRYCRRDMTTVDFPAAPRSGQPCSG